jgi:hypothetical protein
VSPRNRPDDSAEATISRRQVLGLGGAAILGASLTAELVGRQPVAAAIGPATSPMVDVIRPEILSRSAWGQDLPVTGEIVVEEDVRFLLVHHTASTNDYGPDEVVDQIQEFYRFHTGPEKGWPDVAYNFFVDRFGTIWEARAGSIDGPVRGDATGGSQGFALLCSLIGDHAEVEVSPEASGSLVKLLAWLAERHDLDTSPGATVDFVSRGSNRWPAGTAVTAATISGHRDMSLTTCPGDFAYDLIPAVLPSLVSAVREATSAELDRSADTTETSTHITIVPPSSSSMAAGTERPAVDGEAGPEAAGRSDSAANDDDRLSSRTAIVTGVAATAVAVLAAGTARLRQRVQRSG